MSDHFYITTTLPYVNAAPHIGFALEIIEADVIARYQRQLLGKTVIFNTGTDEHGQKIYQKALEADISPQAYCDQWASKFQELAELLNLSYNHFIRTSDDKHVAAAQEFWRRCFDNGDIYTATYQVKYCIGCELAKTESELEDGRCPLHPQQKLELREEENYFFRLSKYVEQLQELYQENATFVRPASRHKEIQSFVANGLTDFSISRLKDKMPWGIPVPNDDQHVMYVWFDALVNYISTLDWPQEQQNFQDFWPGIQVAGKDNLRQQAAMWQAMLLSAKLPTSKQILINGFIGVNGQKMSKSLGNVIAPQELVARYGVDASRYLLIDLGTFSEDVDVTFAKLDTTYQANLANGLGNLCSRLAKMAQQSQLSLPSLQPVIDPEFMQLMDEFALNQALGLLDRKISELDQYLAKETPWRQEENQKKQIVSHAIEELRQIAYQLQIFMPDTADVILAHFAAQPIQAFNQGLFPRLELISQEA